MQKSSFKITSLQNPKIKEAVRLRDRKMRDETGRFLIEGYRELKRAIDAGWKMETVFFCPDFFLGSNERALLEKTGGEVIECTKEVFQKLSYRDRPDGLLGIAPEMRKNLSDLEKLIVPLKNPFLVIAESIEKPGNLGTILRSADAAGADAVIVCDPTTDIHNPNVVRSSVGTLFTVPVFELEGRETLRFLKERGIAIAAATPSAKIEYTKADFTVPVAIAVGTEQYGLSEAWMKEADIQVRIPMFGIADSLNVASATTLVLYEVVRQRKS
ncbi:MAG TPA: RNA methyltransferase [Chlamydiales bacterium]|jgi:TrmH family RNA methyltransferase|nr:RNA methyltransferase [Chlamydiales bacterium]